MIDTEVSREIGQLTAVRRDDRTVAKTAKDVETMPRRERVNFGGRPVDDDARPHDRPAQLVSDEIRRETCLMFVAGAAQGQRRNSDENGGRGNSSS
jgi:hypothetical protein